MLQELFHAFEQSPAEPETQLTLLEALLQVARPDLALRVIAQPMSGTAGQAQIKIQLHAAALDATGDVAAARKLNRALIRTQVARGWALTAEGARYALDGEEVLALRCFRLALDFGVIPAEQQSLQGRVPFVIPDQLGWFYDRYPHLKAERARIDALFRQAVASVTAAMTRFTQADPLITVLGEEGIRALLTRQWQAYEAGDVPLPPFAAAADQDRDHAIAGRKILFLMETTFQKHGHQLPNELLTYLTSAAEQAGLSAATLDAAPLRDASAAEITRQLDQAVTAHGADLVMVLLELTAEQAENFAVAFDHVRRAHGVKLIAYLPDPHEYYNEHVADQWAAHLDAVSVMWTEDSPLLRPYQERDLICPMMYSPLPEAHLTRCGLAAKDLDLMMVGRGDPVRVAMIDAIKPLMDSHMIRFSNHPSYPSDVEGPLSHQDYADALARARFTIDSSHEGVVRSPKGRRGEAISSGVLLLEFDPEKTTQEFLPYIHFVPVANQSQLVAFVRFFKKHPDWRDKIAEAGRDFYQRYYSAVPFWQRLLRKAGL